MSRGTRLGIALVGSALVLGVLGDLLFQGQSLGLNVGLWMLAFAVALTGLLRVARAPLHQGRRFMVAPLLVFAALFAWHSSPLLVAANLLALAALFPGYVFIQHDIWGAEARAPRSYVDSGMTIRGLGACRVDPRMPRTVSRCCTIREAGEIAYSRAESGATGANR